MREGPGQLLPLQPLPRLLAPGEGTATVEQLRDRAASEASLFGGWTWGSGGKRGTAPSAQAQAPSSEGPFPVLLSSHPAPRKGGEKSFCLPILVPRFSISVLRRCPKEAPWTAPSHH